VQRGAPWIHDPKGLNQVKEEEVVEEEVVDRRRKKKAVEGETRAIVEFQGKRTTFE
jgi:hypothetical protein